MKIQIDLQPDAKREDNSEAGVQKPDMSVEEMIAAAKAREAAKQAAVAANIAKLLALQSKQ